ncbi:hypothetical protein PBRA_000821 [Plasmodiophora brassicae]|uniref:Uncharacterized protein n=1 Tax=Plasmodiophora brassicae TaxID=37360 RepID=A0A0G4IQS7_PLABS|nr:hypothetical protein PBRA_000821 [Plasmodiophora brassicae]
MRQRDDQRRLLLVFAAPLHRLLLQGGIKVERLERQELLDTLGGPRFVHVDVERREHFDQLLVLDGSAGLVAAVQGPRTRVLVVVGFLRDQLGCLQHLLLVQVDGQGFLHLRESDDGWILQRRQQRACVMKISHRLTRSHQADDPFDCLDLPLRICSPERQNGTFRPQFRELTGNTRVRRWPMGTIRQRRD